MYGTADEATAMIVTAIEAGDAKAEDYNLDAIFDATFEYSADLQAFVQTVDEQGFWAAVEAAAK